MFDVLVSEMCPVLSELSDSISVLKRTLSVELYFSVMVENKESI